LVDWFHSYLDDRHSFVHISGMLSFSFLIKSGVPQNSTLGPLIFTNILMTFVILFTILVTFYLLTI
jgi:hypothetical protein